MRPYKPKQKAMKTTIKRVPSSGITSYILFGTGTLEKMCAKIEETGIVECDITAMSKTRFGISFQAGEHRLSCNTIPKRCKSVEDYSVKVHAEEKMNYFSGTRTTACYFVKSKKQGSSVLKEHIREMFTDYIGCHLKREHVTIHVLEGKELRQFMDGGEPFIDDVVELEMA